VQVAVPYLTRRAHAKCFIGPDDPVTKCQGTISATPDLYNVMIQMVLSPGSVDVNSMYPGQAFLQVVLLLAAVVAVPVMLLPKPLILKKRHEARFGNVRATASWCCVLWLFVTWSLVTTSGASFGDRTRTRTGRAMHVPAQCGQAHVRRVPAARDVSWNALAMGWLLRSLRERACVARPARVASPLASSS
jgi:V-type ATPase 116kDa subunit family